MTSRDWFRSPMFWMAVLGTGLMLAAFVAGFNQPVQWWSPALHYTCMVLVLLMLLLGITTRLLMWIPGRIAFYVVMIALVFALGQSLSTEFATQQPTIWSRIAMLLMSLTSMVIAIRGYRQKRSAATADQPA